MCGCCSVALYIDAQGREDVQSYTDTTDSINMVTSSDGEDVGVTKVLVV